MKLICLETSAKTASAAIVTEGKVLGLTQITAGLTHSQTVLPAPSSLLSGCSMSIADADGFAVSIGPGSFTGIRIGVATAKGIADGRNLPCIPVSSLCGNAWNVTLTDRLVCPVMDARRRQLYNALFEIRDGIPVRLTEDRLILMEDLKNELISHKKSVLLVGDGAQMCYNTFITSEELDAALAPSGARYPAAYGAAMEAVRLYREGKTVSSAQLMPLYLRQPQAVRERLAREKQAHSE